MRVVEQKPQDLDGVEWGDGERWAYRAPTLCQNQHGNTGKQMADGLNDRLAGRAAKGRVRSSEGGLFTEQQPLILVKELPRALQPGPIVPPISRLAGCTKLYRY